MTAPHVEGTCPIAVTDGAAASECLPAVITADVTSSKVDEQAFSPAREASRTPAENGPQRSRVTMDGVTDQKFPVGFVEHPGVNATGSH